MNQTPGGFKSKSTVIQGMGLSSRNWHNIQLCGFLGWLGSVGVFYQSVTFLVPLPDNIEGFNFIIFFSFLSDFSVTCCDSKEDT